MTIFERIKDLRIKAGMSQEELARKIGYSGRSAVSKIENGERDISQSMIAKYAWALGVSPTFLLYGEEGETAAQPDDELTALLEDLRSNPDKRMLFQLLDGATAEDVRRAVAIIEALRKSDGEGGK